MLYPPKGAARAEPVWGPICFYFMSYFVLETFLDVSKSHLFFDFLRSRKSFISRMGGWVDGNKKGSLISFKLSGMIVHACIYLYIWSTVVNNILMGSKIRSQVGELTSWISNLHCNSDFFNFRAESLYFFSKSQYNADTYKFV